MQIAVIGLGKMGFNIALNLLSNGHEVIALDQDKALVEKAAAAGMQPAVNLENLCASFTGKQIIWLMVPAGPIVDELLQQLTPLLQKGSIVIDGGNSFYKDSIRRNGALAKLGINYLDCGTSGGTGTDHLQHHLYPPGHGCAVRRPPHRQQRRRRGVL